MKKLVIYTTVITAFLFSIISCTDDFKNINTNPYGISNKDLKQLNYHIGGSFAPMFLNVMNVDPAWNYQLQQGLIGDVYSGYMTPPTPFAGNKNNMTYAFVDGWNIYPWSDAYTSVMPFARDIKKTVKSEAQKKYIYLANIIKVTAMHRVSDIYGPIRYTKFDDTKTSGEYDSQETVYKAFFKDLDEAITKLKPFEGDSQFSLFDMSEFKGNIAMWRRYANSLRLRLAIRVSKVAPTLAKTEGEKSLVSDAGFLEAKSMIINTGFTNPVAVISNSWGDIRMSAEMESILKGFKDGRIANYFNLTDKNDKDKDGKSLQDKGYDYKGIRMGIKIDAKSEYVGHSPIGSVISTRTFRWMSAAEVYFLRAEAALRGWAGAGDAKTNYEAGVTASFTENGTSGVGTYLMDNTSTPNDFVDAFHPENNIAYPGDVKIAYNSAGTKEEQLEQIITQKWIAMFPDGQEAWSEFRRTGYPRIFPVVVNNSSGTIDTNIQVRRINFVTSEKNTNADNVTKAVTLLKGADNGGTRLWWDTGTPNF